MKLGLNAKLYWDAAGTATPSNEIPGVRDLTYNDEREEIDISTRGCPVALTATSLQKISLSWDMLWDEGDADFTGLQAAYAGNTAIAIKCVSSGTLGKGVLGDFVITKFNRKEGLKDAIMVECEVKPTYVARNPSAI